MHESLYSEKITIFSPKGTSTMKVDIIKHETFIEIRLIETSNIFTLFVCTISQSDFYMYKKEQEILVSYDRFIPILINMFYKISTNEGNLTATMVTKNDNQFSLQFVEQTEFKNIKKLELTFNKPEEFQYRKYLGDLLSRMENDNIKLIKENKILRERAIRGDKSLNDKLRFLESENADVKKRLEIVNEELSTVEYKYNSEREEFYQMSNKISELERENAQLNFELEKYHKANSPNLQETLTSKKKELTAKENELFAANENISKLKEENKELKSFKAKIEAENSQTAQAGLETMKNKTSYLENKVKAYKSEVREKKERIEKLQAENRSLSKRLETAQNVYSYFHDRKSDDRDDMNNFTLEPENPPNTN
ncbi:Sas-6 [Nucleospora cyclopteri]